MPPLLSRAKAYASHLRQHLVLAEFSGALGDLGTLLPILVSLTATGQASLSASLIFGGLWNILSGVMFRVPVCVQPMKAIAAVAIASKMTTGELMAAGMGVSGVVLALGITRTITLVAKLTPHPVIKGIQLGAGLTLITKATAMVTTAPAGNWGGSDMIWSDNYYWTMAAFVFVYWFYMSRRMPSALIIFVIGLVFAGIRIGTAVAHPSLPSVGSSWPRIVVPTWEEFKRGFVNASLGQLPLTTLNSVIAVVALSHDLFPQEDIKRRMTCSKMATSVGIMNLIGCFFGSVPYCHGSGGLAAQYRFGARSEMAVYILGAFKILVGVLFGDSLVGLLKQFPSSMLGVMLFVAGSELSLAARNFSLTRPVVYVYDDANSDEDTSAQKRAEIEQKEQDIEQARTRDFVILIVTAGSLVGFKNDGIGFLCGMAVALMFWIRAKLAAKYPSRFGNGGYSMSPPAWFAQSSIGSVPTNGAVKARSAAAAGCNDNADLDSTDAQSLDETQNIVQGTQCGECAGYIAIPASATTSNKPCECPDNAIQVAAADSKV